MQCRATWQHKTWTQWLSLAYLQFNEAHDWLGSLWLAWERECMQSHPPKEHNQRCSHGFLATDGCDLADNQTCNLQMMSTTSEVLGYCCLYIDFLNHPHFYTLHIFEKTVLVYASVFYISFHCVYVCLKTCAMFQYCPQITHLHNVVNWHGDLSVWKLARVTTWFMQGV